MLEGLFRGPDANTTIDTINIPNPVAGNSFVQPVAGTSEFTATAFHTLPCNPGTYSKRFHIFPNGLAGNNNITPGRGLASLIFFIDVNVTVTNIDKCENKITLETFMMEFRLGFDFTHAGALPGVVNELAEVRPTLPVGMAGGVVNTHNIAKRISVNGVATDTEFPAKAP